MYRVIFFFPSSLGNLYYRMELRTIMQDSDGKYEFSFRVSEGYPQNLLKWRGLPSGGVNAAFQWKSNRRTYFFHNKEYYRFYDPGFRVSWVFFSTLEFILKFYT